MEAQFVDLKPYIQALQQCQKNAKTYHAEEDLAKLEKQLTKLVKPAQRVADREAADRQDNYDSTILPTITEKQKQDFKSAITILETLNSLPSHPGKEWLSIDYLDELFRKEIYYNQNTKTLKKIQYDDMFRISQIILAASLIIISFSFFMAPLTGVAAIISAGIILSQAYQLYQNHNTRVSHALVVRLAKKFAQPLDAPTYYWGCGTIPGAQHHSPRPCMSSTCH